MDLEGLYIIDVEPDGNCLFRAVSQQLYGDAERHLEASVVEKEKEKTWHSIRRIAYSTSNPNAMPRFYFYFSITLASR